MHGRKWGLSSIPKVGDQSSCPSAPTVMVSVKSVELKAIKGMRTLFHMLDCVNTLTCNVAIEREQNRKKS